VTDGGVELPDAGARDAGTAPCPDGIPIELVAGKLVLTVTINGADHRLMYDSGAPTSWVVSSLAQSLGTGAVTVVIAGKTITPVHFTAGSNALAAEGVEGIIGTDVVGTFAVTVDYQRARFWLDESRDEAALLGCTHASGTPKVVGFMLESYVFVPGAIESTEGWMLVDTGATYGGVPQTMFNTLVAAAPRPFLTGFYTAAPGGTFWADLGALGSAQTAGLKVEHLIARSIPNSYVAHGAFPDGKPFLGLLPSGFLKHFLVTIDFPAKQLRLDPYLGDSGREPTSVFSTGIALPESTAAPFTVNELLGGSAALEAGVQVGDEVRQIAGQDVGALSDTDRPWELCAPTAGKTIAVTVRHNGVDTTMMLETRDVLTDP
jgi:hypothetical protein